MNPILIFYLFIGGFILWITTVVFLPQIGEYIKAIIDEFKEKMEGENDNDD